MTVRQPARRRAAAVWRTVRCGAVALRAIHDEQVLMWELFWQASRVPADRARPLAWVASLDGPQLTGSHLPTPDDATAPGGHERTIHDFQTNTRPGGDRRPHCVGATRAACRGDAATEVVNRCLT